MREPKATTSRGGHQTPPPPKNRPVFDPNEPIDRRNPEFGVYEGITVKLLEPGGVWKGLDRETRAKRWKSLTMEAKEAKFRKRYYPASHKRLPFKKTFEPAARHIQAPVEAYGMPLGKFPEHKYIHQKRSPPRNVHYSIDEYDFEWLKEINAERVAKDQQIISIPMFEFWLDRLEKCCKWQPKEYEKQKDDNGEEVDDVCNICLDGDTSNCNQIVYCDKCELAVHQDCYGIPFLPEGALECRRCALSPGKAVSCVLCPSRTGAFKQVDHQRWAHVLCVIWVDETHFGNTIFMENVQNVDKALHDRRSLSCMLCKNSKDKRMGACIQCSETKCTASFHVTCARNGALVMRIQETDDGQVNRFVWCPRHAPPETDDDLEHRQLVLRNAKRENERRMPTISSSMPTLTTKDISAISEEEPVFNHKEIVLFWYQKRQNRLGAPLLKNYTPDDEEVKSPRRLSKKFNLKISMSPSEMKKQVEEVGESLVSAITTVNLILQREEMKKSLINASLRLVERGFMPTDLLCSQMICSLKTQDKQEVFAQPVNVKDYEKFIKNPMDLSTMTRKLEAGEYATVDTLVQDVELMIENCKQFNKTNPWFKNYAIKYKKSISGMLETAQKEESERMKLLENGRFMTELLNGMMSGYLGWSEKRAGKVEEIADDLEHLEPNSSKNSKKKRQISPEKIKIEEEDFEVKKGGKRGRKDSDSEESDKEDDISDNTKKSTKIGKSTRKNPDSGGFGSSQVAQTLKKRVEEGLSTPKSSKKAEMRQTTLTSFFSSAAPTPNRTVVSFADFGRNNGQKSLFTPTSTPSTSQNRPSTRSLSTPSSSLSASGIRQNSFRISSAAIQSPLPEPTKVGIRRLQMDDEDEEIVINPPPKHLTPQEIEAEKLKWAENEAKSKFVHNQLVIVDGRAAKVIESHLAHVSEVHLEQRQSMLKKRREVLGEIPQGSMIYVEFFQKSNTLENFKWVVPDNVELLDLSSVGLKTTKIPGLKAAREWHQKVINGENV